MRDYNNVYPWNDDYIIVLRRFGPRFEKQCKRPAVVECALCECQEANCCQAPDERKSWHKD